MNQNFLPDKFSHSTSFMSCYWMLFWVDIWRFFVFNRNFDNIKENLILSHKTYINCTVTSWSTERKSQVKDWFNFMTSTGSLLCSTWIDTNTPTRLHIQNIEWKYKNLEISAFLNNKNDQKQNKISTKDLQWNFQ